MKRFLIAAALLGLTAPLPASAAESYVWTTSCNAYRCTSYFGPRTYDNSATVVRIPHGYEQANENPNWGQPSEVLPRGCRSCADATK